MRNVRFFSSSKNGVLWSTHSSIPRLPLPKLDDTLNGFLESVKPIVSSEEYQQCKLAVEQVLCFCVFYQVFDPCKVC